MPEKEERELKAQARKKGLTGDRFNAYVYGTLSKIEKARESKHSTKSHSRSKSSGKKR
jgi:hypothetical protein